MALTVNGLDKDAHDRQAFDCREPALNEFLRTRAAKHQALGVSRTFVLTDDIEPHKILGFYSLSNCQIGRDDISPEEARKLPRYPLPAILLARLGVDQNAQGQGYGELLLMDVIKRCALVSQQTGVYALIVDAKHNHAKLFYERFGFAQIKTQALTLYLPLATAIQLL
jgi:GNAT superfamily N-acetyltransferase